MTLDLGATASQLDALATHLQQGGDDWHSRLSKTLQRLSQGKEEEINHKLQKTTKALYGFSPAGIGENIYSRYTPRISHKEFSVLAIDGSQIDVDRHIPVPLALLNIGVCILSYGSIPDAHLSNHPRLYAEDDLYLLDQTSGSTKQLEGDLLEVYCSVEEVRALASYAKHLPKNKPAIALIDGSLILWALESQRDPEFVKTLLLKDGYLQALNAIHDIALEQPLALAAYISFPRSKEVVNAIRLSFCPYDTAHCQQHCHSLVPGKRPCDTVHGLLDRDLFSSLLKPGERSALFFSQSPLMSQYEENQVHFYYINVGQEIARVEIPDWVAKNPQLLDMTHSMILDQCHRGNGYPAAITEAHEQAVINGADRDQFQGLLERILDTHHIAMSTSQKSRSKRLRSL